MNVNEDLLIGQSLVVFVGVLLISQTPESENQVSNLLPKTKRENR